MTTVRLPGTPEESRDRGAPPDAAARQGTSSPVADALAVTLRDWGVRELFGVGGANIEHLHDAVHRLGDGRLRSVLTTREDAGAFMADAQARLDGRLAVCCSTSGGAMLNLVAGLGESLADGVGVLAIVGHPPTSLDGRGGFQEATGRPGTVDALALLRSVTAHAERIERGPDLWPALRRALAATRAARPGPAALLVPRDVFAEDAGPPPGDWPADPATAAVRPAVGEDHVRTLAAALAAARRPLLVLGPEVRRGPDADAVLGVARRRGLPVATTVGALEGLERELSAGIAGAIGHPSLAAALADDVDLVVVAGSGLEAMWRGPLERRRDLRVAVVARDTTVARAAIDPWWCADGDAGPVFAMLDRLLDEGPLGEPAPGHPPLAGAVEQWLPLPAAPTAGLQAHPRGGGETLTASAATPALARAWPPGGHVVFDAGDCVSVVLHGLRLPLGTRSTLAFGMGGMGYSIPAAIGIALATGGPVTAVCGDGAFLMNGLEMLTAVDHELPVLLVVLNNQMHGMCAVRQDAMFGGRHEAVTHAALDVTATVRGLGSPDRLWVAGAGHADEVVAALADYHARAGHGPGVLEVRIAQEEVPPGMAFSDPGAPRSPLP